MMSQKYDAIILGAGIAGLGTGIALARKNKKVLVIGKPAMPGEASPAAAGILDPLLEMKSGTPVLDLCLEAFRRYPALIRDVSNATRQPVGYEELGMFYIAMSEAEEKDLKKRYDWQKKTGFPVEWKSRKWILKKEPALSPAIRSGLFYPTVKRIYPPEWMRALEIYGKKHGLVISKQSQDASIDIQNGKVKGVRIGKKFFASSVVVNATGSWAGAIRKLGARPPVLPARGQILMLAGRDLKIKSILHTLNGGYIVPWKEREYLTGSTVEFVKFRPHVTASGIKGIRRKIEKLVPQAKNLKPARSWAGLRPFSKDRLPLIGPTKTQGLYWATGFFRSGILLGCYVGELLAQGIVSGKMPQVLKPFSPLRFEKNGN